jgi:hypothetical protein
MRLDMPGQTWCFRQRGYPRPRLCTYGRYTLADTEGNGVDAYTDEHDLGEAVQDWATHHQ